MLSRRMDRLMVQRHQLSSLQGNHGIRLAVIVAELNFINTRRPILNHSANLAANQPFFRQILKHGHYRMHLNICHREPSLT
jgi:hypothetical protein